MTLLLIYAAVSVAFASGWTFRALLTANKGP